MELDTLLNPSQKEAVLYNDGPSIIVAGAGSGKTRVLTYKIAYLMELGIPASRIMALTFTNKAAREMKERIAAVVGQRETRYLWMGTFHSIFTRILRAEAATIGFTPQFTIYDTADSKNLIKSLVKELRLDEKSYSPASILSRISNLKNRIITPSAYSNDSLAIAADAKNNLRDFATVYQLYCNRCQAANAMDFDDILVFTYSLFSQCPEILERYRERFAFILVDEYQDTNTVQHAIVQQLAGRSAQVCVVGDDAQSIYSFRGAQIDNMLTFQKLFPSARLFKLEQNYRSTQCIVNAANSLISKNVNQIKKNVYSEQGKGSPIEVIEAYSDYDEATRVAQSIVSQIDRHLFDYQDIAILYRTNAQSRVLEDALRREGIPYKIYGGLSFYQRKEIKDIMAYLRLMINPTDEESLKRIINYPARGIGDTTLNKLITHIHETGAPAMDVLSDAKATGLDVNSGTAAKLAAFAALIRSMSEFHASSDAYRTVEYVLNASGMIADVSRENTPESESRKENLQEFLNAVQEFCDKRLSDGDERVTIADFLSEISLLTDQDDEQAEQANAVTLMTVHASKGLEYGSIYIVGMEENLFPSQRAESLRDLEEERRLFYVAITRAKECCTVSYAKSRFMHGQSQFTSPSRFLYDIDSRYINMPARTRPAASTFVNPFARQGSYAPRSTSSPAKKAEVIRPQPAPRRLTPVRETAASARTAPSVPCSYAQGDTVLHTIFGRGTVSKIEGSGDSTKATIEFDSHGTKQLLLKFARLKKL